MIANVAETIAYVTAPAESAQETGILDQPKKLMAIRLRWLLVILCSYLLTFSDEGMLSRPIIDILVFLYIFTNAALYSVNERFFDSSYFYTPLVIFDTFYVTASLIV